MWSKLIKDAARHAARQGKLPAPRQELLAQIWPTLVGEVIARRSRPLSLVDQTLHIEVDHPNLVRELSFHPLPLLGRVRQYSPWTIERLEVSYNPALVPSDGNQSRPPRQKDAPAPASPAIKGPTVAGIDDELQRIIDSIAAHRRERGEDS